MIENGADILLPRNWLSDAAYFKAFDGDNWVDEHTDERLWRRFPNITFARQGSTRNDIFYAISDLLECFRLNFGTSLDSVKTSALQQENQGLVSAPSRQVASSSTHGVRFNVLEEDQEWDP